jgi:hypothetical protein
MSVDEETRTGVLHVLVVSRLLSRVSCLYPAVESSSTCSRRVFLAISTTIPRVCVMAVDTSKRIWLTSLVRGRFDAQPALRPTGTAGPRRLPTSEEQQRWLRRVRSIRRLRGHDLLFRKLTHVRDLTFEENVPVRLGVMTRGSGS